MTWDKRTKMDSNRFKKCGYECVEWAIRYMETLDERLPLPNVTPGWLWNVVPPTAPEKPESFDKIMKDVEPVVLHGVLVTKLIFLPIPRHFRGINASVSFFMFIFTQMAHWQHRQFFSYFPAGNAWSSVMGDIFSNATGVNGTNWVTKLVLALTYWHSKFLKGLFLV